MTNKKIVVVFKETGQKDTHVTLDFEKSGVNIRVDGGTECMSLTLARFFALTLRTEVKKFAAERGAVIVEFPPGKNTGRGRA